MTGGKSMTAEEGTIHDDWRATSTGRYLDGRIKSLILDLTAPRAGERLLDVGCGSGEHLGLFRRKGCDVTGIDPSPFLLDQACQRLRSRAELRIGPAEDLPFSDNEFDIVTLINSLEFTDDPGLAVAEAIRVCRGRVFIGVMNRYSLIGAQGRLTNLFNPASQHERPFLPPRLPFRDDPEAAPGGPDPVGQRHLPPLGLVRLRHRPGGAAPRDEQPFRRLLRPLLLRDLHLPDDPGDHPGARRS